MEKKFKTQKSVSGTGNRFIDGMTKFFKLVSPKYLIGGTALLLFLAMLASCKKQGECADGIQYLNFNTESPTKSPKSNDCDDQRGARDSAEYRLNEVYAPGVRNAVEPALTEPDDISHMYWINFNITGPFETLLDSAARHKVIIESLGIPGSSAPFNDANLRILYEKCGRYLVGDEDLKAAQAALEDCEGLGIDEWKWVEDPNNPCIRIWQRVH